MVPVLAENARPDVLIRVARCNIYIMNSGTLWKAVKSVDKVVALKILFCLLSFHSGNLRPTIILA